MRTKTRLKKYKVFHTLTVVLTVCIMLQLSGCSNTVAPVTKDLRLGSNYEITAVLDPYNKTLEYTAQAHIRNSGQSDTDELYFHLYGNLYKTETEGITVNSIIDESGNAISYVPEDNDQLLRLTLNGALAGGGETTAFFDCTVTIPDMISVFGVARDNEIHLPFFSPELAMHDKNGWNTKPLAQAGDGRYLALSDYTLSIQAPSEYEIVCNGAELLRETQNGQTAYTFQANQRREIVVTAYTDYVHMERVVGKTRILGYFNANRFSSQSDMENTMDAAAFSMDYYNRTFMVYPFDTLIITNGTSLRGDGANMEYSGLFTVAGFSVAATYHEMAHQWFYFLVGNNENEEPWLDEAFATFAHTICEEAAGFDRASWWGFQKDVAYEYEAGKAINVSYDEAENYTDLFYNRGAYFLKELMDAMGRDEFLSILSEYCETYAFGFATTEGFISLLRERTPVDVDDIIDEYIGNR